MKLKANVIQAHKIFKKYCKNTYSNMDNGEYCRHPKNSQSGLELGKCDPGVCPFWKEPCDVPMEE